MYEIWLNRKQENAFKLLLNYFNVIYFMKKKVFTSIANYMHWLFQKVLCKTSKKITWYSYSILRNRMQIILFSVNISAYNSRNVWFNNWVSKKCIYTIQHFWLLIILKLNIWIEVKKKTIFTIKFSKILDL